MNIHKYHGVVKNIRMPKLFYLLLQHFYQADLFHLFIHKINSSDMLWEFIYSIINHDNFTRVSHWSFRFFLTFLPDILVIWDFRISSLMPHSEVKWHLSLSTLLQKILPQNCKISKLFAIMMIVATNHWKSFDIMVVI